MAEFVLRDIGEGFLGNARCIRTSINDLPVCEDIFRSVDETKLAGGDALLYPCSNGNSVMVRVSLIEDVSAFIQSERVSELSFGKDDFRRVPTFKFEIKEGIVDLWIEDRSGMILGEYTLSVEE